MRKQITLRYWSKVISKYGISIWIIFIVCLVTSFFLCTQMPKIYKATAYIYVPGDVKIFDIAGLNGFLRFDKVSNSHENRKRWYLSILKNESTARMIAQILPDRSVETIQKNSDIERLSNGLQFRISVQDKDPEMAAKIATAYPSAVDSILREMYIYPMEIEKAKKENAIREYERRLKKVEKQIQQLKAENKIVIVSKHKELLQNKRASFISQLEKSRLQLKEVNSEILILEKQLAKEEKMQVSSQLVAANPVIDQLRATLASLQVSLAGTMAKYSEEHPKVMRLRAEYAQAQKNLKKEVNNSLKSQTKTINPVHGKLREMLITNLVLQKSLSARTEALKAIIKEVDERLVIFPSIEQNIARLKREADDYDRALKQATLQFEKAGLKELRDQKIFKLLHRVAIPQKPSFPNPSVNIFLAFSLASGIALIYITCRALIARTSAPKTRALVLPKRPKSQTHLIAEKLVYKGLLTPEQVSDILTIQLKESGLRFLAIAVKRGYLTKQQVLRMMKIKSPALLIKSSRSTKRRKPSFRQEKGKHLR
jgi:uncharacterized protein involved in exopolysaccharide biosynthesis